MKAVLSAAFLLLVSLAAYAQESSSSKLGDPVLIADAYFWTGPEGNLGVEITGKFQSEEKLKNTLNLDGKVGRFKSKKFPFDDRNWVLRDVLVTVDLNAQGPVAIWRVCGPKPLIASYLEGLKKRHEDKSLFSDFGYKPVNFKPSTN
jgi:hypothetical protein